MSKNPCVHLEKKINIHPNKGRLSSAFEKEHVDVVMRDIAPLQDTRELEIKLKAYGLQEYEIELLLDRIVANLSFEEIKKKHGYVSTKKSIWRLYTQLIEKLQKSSKFKQILKGMNNEGT